MNYAVMLPVLILWWSLPLFAGQSHIDFAQEDITTYSISEQSDTGIELTNTMGGLTIEEVSTTQGVFLRLDADGYTQGPWEKGWPQLPVRAIIIEIPQKADLRVKVEDIEETLVDLNALFFNEKIIPCQAPKPKNMPYETTVLDYDKALYIKNQVIAPERATAEIRGTLRSVRLARVTLCPFRYNPATNSLWIARRMTVTISYENADLALTRSLRQTYQNQSFEAPLTRVDSRLSLSGRTKDVIIKDNGNQPLTYVVVASKAYLSNSALRDLITWKTISGFRVIEADTSSIFQGKTNDTDKRDSLKAYLNNLYTTEENPPVYILFVGDTTQIPAYKICKDVYNGEVLQDHYTDLYYCEYTEDHLPDAYYGRFPVNTDAQLTRVATKTRKYEQCTMPSLDHLGTSVLIAGADPDDSPTYANGQVAYLLNEYVNTDNGFSTIYAFIYESLGYQNIADTESLWENTVIQTTGSELATGAILDALSPGAGFVNYSGHCDEYGWYNQLAKDYEINSNDVDDLADSDLFGFYVANCCESSRMEMSRPGSFGAETLLSEHKGAAAYLGAANVTYWASDFSWAVGYKAILGIPGVPYLNYKKTTPANFDALWHTHEEPQDQWFISAGQMVYAGNLSVETHHDDPAFDIGKFYWEIYNVMGDPSLCPYMGTPKTIAEPDLPVIIPCEDSHADFLTEPYARVTLSKDNTLLGSALAGEDGYATVTFTPLESECDLTLVITKQNYKPLTMVFPSDAFPDIPPQASFSTAAIEVTANKEVTFTNTSFGCPTEFSWKFQGAYPTSSSKKNPTVIFRDSGIYDVTLTVANSNSTSDPFVKSIHVLPGKLEEASDSSSGGGGCFIGSLNFYASGGPSGGPDFKNLDK